MITYIYKIHSIEGDCCYIGKTTRKGGKKRYFDHQYDYRNREKRFYCSSFEVLKYEDNKFEILAEFDTDRHHASTIEKHYINNTPNSINIRR
jgi:hypothetical protein